MRYMLSMSYGEAEPGVPPMSEWPTTDIKAHIESQRALPRCTGLVPWRSGGYVKHWRPLAIRLMLDDTRVLR